MMKKSLTILLFFILLQPSGFANSSYLKDRLNFRIGYQQYPWMGDLPRFNAGNVFNATPVGALEAHYGVLDFLEVGPYFGLSYYERADFSEMQLAFEGLVEFPVSTPLSTEPMYLYGVNVNLHLLPLFVKRDELFVDLYLSSKLGGIHFTDRNTEIVLVERTRWDYGIYGGIALYPLSFFGFYYEYGFGNYLTWKAGISLKF